MNFGIAKLGDVGYTFLLWVNHHYNAYREKKGLPYFSLSQMVKAKVKSAVSFISDYENELVKVKGNVTALVGLIQQKFGISKEDAEKKVEELLAKYNKEEFKQEIKEKLEVTAAKFLDTANTILDVVKDKIKKQ